MTDNEKLMKLRQKILGRKVGVLDTIRNSEESKQLNRTERFVAGQIDSLVTVMYDAIISDIDQLIMDNK